MQRRDAQILTPDGLCSATLHLPDQPGPAVVLYPDAGGARDVMRAMGDRLASWGYVVLVPDVYYREGNWQPFNMATAFGDTQERGRLFATMGTLTPDRIDADAGSFLDFLADQPEVTGELVGLTGYCMGGRSLCGWRQLMRAGWAPWRHFMAATSPRPTTSTVRTTLPGVSPAWC